MTAAGVRTATLGRYRTANQPAAAPTDDTSGRAQWHARLVLPLRPTAAGSGVGHHTPASRVSESDHRGSVAGAQSTMIRTSPAR